MFIKSGDFPTMIASLHKWFVAREPVLAEWLLAKA